MKMVEVSKFCYNTHHFVSVEKEVHLYLVSWSTSEHNSPRNTGINACTKAGSHVYSLQAYF